MRILIKNGRVIDPANDIDTFCDVLVENGKIAKIGSFNATADKIIDASKKWVVPGLIDIHVHFREPGYEHKESIETGALAAAKGGFTTVCVMANTSPVIDNAEMVEFVTYKGKNSVINILPVGAVTKGLAGNEITDFHAMSKVGAVALSDDGKYIEDASVMKAALIKAKELGLPIFSHCECSNSIGDEIEINAIKRDIDLATEVGSALHICHISTAGGVTLVREAKSRGECITAEVAPHHFTLCLEEIPQNDTNYKMAPPINKKRDVLSIKEALRDGVINVIATDHAPHSINEKNQPYNDAPNGVIGLETAVPLAIELVREGWLTPSKLIEKMTINPARIIGIKKGTLSIGADADITIIDPEKKYVYDVNTSASKSRNSPFNGRKMQGFVDYTIYNGVII